MIAIAVLVFFAVVVVPELCYAFASFDRHYFGYFHEPEPYYAKTTANQKYYSEHNIPFVTAADIRMNYERAAWNRSKGLPLHFELDHKQHYTFTYGVKKIYNMLPSVPSVGIKSGHRRL